jgi:hypothetical protein
MKFLRTGCFCSKGKTVQLYFIPEADSELGWTLLQDHGSLDLERQVEIQILAIIYRSMLQGVPCTTSATAPPFK